MAYTDPLVSIIIPCYNQGKYITQTVESALSSTYSNFEIIIVDDGSKDKFTLDTLHSSSWLKTKIFYTSNQGVSNARNYGIKKSIGKYILPLDADDLIDKTYIEKAVDILENQNETFIVYCRARFFGKKNRVWNLPEYSLEMMLGQNIIFCSALFRRLDFNKTHGYNSNMNGGFEDWDFWLSLIETNLGSKVVMINEYLFYYRIKSHSRNNTISSDVYSQLRKTIYNNHRKLYSEFFFNPINSFEYSNLKRSLEFRIGSNLLFPFRKLISLFYAIHN
jgi:glycosyltransferase involved in cell wall biosynthesis